MSSVAVLAGCDDTSSRDSSAASRNVSALLVVASRIPPLPAPNYRTSGTFPQVASARINVKGVNAGLRRALVAAQRDYVSQAVREAQSRMPELFERGYRYTGIYQTSIDRRLLSASTVVVSALIPTLRLLPGGNDGSTWMSVTVQVPSGSKVGLLDLFTERARGFRALAAAVRRKVVTTNSCIGPSITSRIVPSVGRLNAQGFAPKLRNYRYFALTARGLAVGLPNGQVGGPSCGRVLAIVPYGVLRPYLSPLGRKLILGVRRPKA